MTRDELFIGSSPTEENCVQVSPHAMSYEAQRAECRAYIDALRRKLGPEPVGATLKLKRQDHDFGSYTEVVCVYDADNEEASLYAQACESDGPSLWAEVGMSATILTIDGQVKITVKYDPAWRPDRVPGNDPGQYEQMIRDQLIRAEEAAKMNKADAAAKPPPTAAESMMAWGQDVRDRRPSQAFRIA